MGTDTNQDYFKLRVLKIIDGIWSCGILIATLIPMFCIYANVQSLALVGIIFFGGMIASTIMGAIIRVHLDGL